MRGSIYCAYRTTGAAVARDSFILIVMWGRISNLAENAKDIIEAADHKLDGNDSQKEGWDDDDLQFEDEPTTIMDTKHQAQNKANSYPKIITMSAPGKVLIAGGYLVLEKPNQGVVLAAEGCRFHTTVTFQPPYSSTAARTTP